MAPRLLAGAAVTLLASAGCSDKKDPGPPALPRCENPVSGSTVTTREVGRVVGGALLATSPPADPRLFVLEQRGAIRIFKDHELLPDPFLDLSVDADGPVVAGGEQGLLGLAFHPSYASNGTFFIFYTTRTGGQGLRDVTARCQVSAANPDLAEPTCTEILSIPDFASNHNGGMIEFGRDGYLYIATGDGGGGGDPQRVGQDANSLLGKILRIDVDRAEGGNAYGIPADNPYASGGGAPEIFITGVRNPWRWSFDRETGDMWIADVGQDAIEELTVLRPSQQRGANLGWSMYEGNNCFREPCDPANMVFPQDTRRHADGWASITGGQVYRGTCYPDLVGWYFYTDYERGGLSKARLQSDGTLEIVDLQGSFPRNVASIHEDARGELYLTSTDGRVHHLEAGP